MTEQKPSKIREAGSIVAVGLFLVLSWIALAVVIVFGALGDVMLFDRFHALAATLTDAQQAWWLWVGGLGFSLLCYGCGVWRAAQWFAIVPNLREQQHRAGQLTAARERVQYQQGDMPPKTGPSPEEIARRGMPRG